MTDFYERKTNELSSYKCDQTIIINKKYLSFLSEPKYDEEIPSPIPQTTERHPFTNSYYPYTEDVDAFARVNNLLTSKVSLDSFTTIKNCDYECLLDNEIYSEKMAQLQYLYSNPASFLILSKPGIGEHEVGKLLAGHWKCVYISPATLISEEIASNTRAGRCIEFNLRNGRSIGADIILRLLEKRVKSKSAMHRGFVLCGFPLISTKSHEDPISSESAVFNVEEIYDEIVEMTLDIGTAVTEVLKSEELLDEAPSDDEGEFVKSEKTFKLSPRINIPLDVGSASSNLCEVGGFEDNIEEQITFIFEQFSTPFLIIYIMCGNSDCISIHNGYRFDVDSKQNVDLQREHADRTIYNYSSRVSGSTNDKIPNDFIDVIKNNPLVFNEVEHRLLVKLPSDFPINTSKLLHDYRRHALPIIERYILNHDVEYFIKLDGRISPIRMFNALKAKLHTLPLQKVVLPKKLLEFPDMVNEDGPVDELTLDKCFQNFSKRQIPSPMFKWGWSDWRTKCPVSMREGIYRDGNRKFAVHFMNKIFFLADEEAYIKFYRNPRLFLMPPYPKPSTKIFVMGPHCSGRTAVSNCLSYLLKAEVLDYGKLAEEFVKAKRAEYQDQIRSLAMFEAMAQLNEMRKNEKLAQEQKRKEDVNAWLEQKLQLLEKMIELKNRMTLEKDVDSNKTYPLLSIILSTSSFPIQLSHKDNGEIVLSESEPSVETKEAKAVECTIEDLQKLIRLNALPGVEDLKLCEQLITNHKLLLTYLPSELETKEYKVEPATPFDDFVKEYVENAVKNASYEGTILTTENLANMLIETIKGVDERGIDVGWIVDGVIANEELMKTVFSKYSPHMYVLRDGDDYEFLLQRFQTKGQNQFRDFKRLFVNLGKPDAAWRSPSLSSTTSYTRCLVDDLLNEIIDESYAKGEFKEDDSYFNKHPRRSEIEAYRNNLNKFDEDWNTLGNIIAEYKIEATEINVTDKSLEDLLREVVKIVDDNFRQLASEFTSEDRVQEVEEFSEPEIPEEEIDEVEENAFLQNRRYGDTFHYCPVTFHDFFVLWKGKEECAAKFENKVYLMCNETSMQSFIQDPRKYLLLNKPPSRFPRPRICLIGPRGCGKTTTVQKLCNNLGLFKRDYDTIIRKCIKPKSKLPLSEIIKSGVAGSQGDNLNNYFLNDEPLSEDLLNQALKPLWFDHPAKTFGFVLEGFPRRPTDVDYMKDHAIIPDIVVEIVIDQNNLYERMMQIFSADWQKSLKLKQKEQTEIFEMWQEARNDKFQELMEIKREERYVEITSQKEQDLAEAVEEAENKSRISYDSVAEQADVEEINKILAEQFPEPVFDDVEENLEDAAAKFGEEIEDSFRRELDFLQNLRERCEAELIPWVTIEGGMTVEKVFAQAMRVVDKIAFRNGSLFERVYEISHDLSEKLLSSGYYFLSKFGKTCPVQIYENVNPIQMYIPSEKTFNLFPVIHRQLIYFLTGRESLQKFKENPLKYTSQKNVGFPLIPLKLAIIGPPKSGKTTLAERFKRNFGMQVISPGNAGRYVLEHLEFSQLAKNMEFVLRSGWELTTEMKVKCVESLSFDAQCVTQGFVLDGIPNTIEEVQHLAQIGLMPHIMLDLRAKQSHIYDFLSMDAKKWDIPNFSENFITYRYNKWLQRSQTFRDWLQKEYQILTAVMVTSNKWKVWCESDKLVKTPFSEIKYYHEQACNEVALRLRYMQVTPLEFIDRRGHYKSYCPCCLYYDKALVSGGEPPDRTGLVQFRKYFYYLCPKHIDQFLNNPEQFIIPKNPRLLPSNLPACIFLMEMPIDCHQEGICIVCYWLNQPRRVINKGTLKYAIRYQEKVYLFDRYECMEIFMREPTKFFAIAINFKGRSYPSLEYKELPVLGLLQQYDAMQIIKAVNNTGILRPIIPGLSISVSAALNVGLFLKVNNPKTPEKFIDLYKKAQEKFQERRLNLIDYLAQMKKIINPYLYYDDPMHMFVDPLFLAAKSATEMQSNEDMNCNEERDTVSSTSMSRSH